MKTALFITALWLAAGAVFCILWGRMKKFEREEDEQDEQDRQQALRDARQIAKHRKVTRV